MMIPDRERLLQLVDGLEDQPVLMLIDVVADRFLYGVPKRISREAPVLILRWTGETVALGGGANAAANIRSLGGIPLPVGCVGEDSAADELLEVFEAAGITTEGIVRRPAWPTPTKTRILAGYSTGSKQQIVRYDREELEMPAPPVLEALRERISRFSGRARVGVLSDYGYGAVLPELAPAVRAALSAPGLVLVDSRFRLGDFRGVDGATPNEEEAEALAGEVFETADTVERASATIRRQIDARFLLVTRGSRGMAFSDGSGTAHIPVHGSSQVADVTGAGDTVIGTFALALAAGASPLEATLIANYAGGVVVMKAGTATVSPAELREAIRTDSSPLEHLAWAAT